jgi:c-di-GMP-binding flagellar brake protein YcgR
MENQRKNERVVPDESDPIEVQIMGDGFLEILTAKDIGPGGVGIYVEHGFQGLNIIRDVEIVISIPGEKSFKARGVIKHKRQLSNYHSEKQDFFGILFTQICNKHRQLLERYVEERFEEKRQDMQKVPDSDIPMEVNTVKEPAEV